MRHPEPRFVDAQLPQCVGRRRVQAAAAPLGEGGERTVPLGRLLRSSAQRRHTAAQAGEQQMGREQPQPARREFHRQRQAAEQGAQLGHGPGVLQGQREGRIRVPGAPHEQGDAGHLLQFLGVGRPARTGCRDGQRSQRQQLFPVDAERLQRGGQHHHPRVGQERRRGPGRSRARRMVAAVQYDEHPPGSVRQRTGGFEQRRLAVRDRVHHSDRVHHADHVERGADGPHGLGRQHALAHMRPGRSTSPAAPPDPATARAARRLRLPGRPAP